MSAESVEISLTVSSSIASAYLPRLYQPVIDINNGNGLIDTYVKVFDEKIYGYSLPGKYIIEVTSVFADEDHPDPTMDKLYDAYRLVSWGRIEDLETFFIVVDKTTGKSERLSFIELWMIRFYPPSQIQPVKIQPCYSGDETWDATFGPHFRAKITSFSKYYQHPILYVNVWNHALGEKDNNQGMSKSRYDTWYSYSSGSRKDAENDYNILYWYLVEGTYESP